MFSDTAIIILPLVYLALQIAAVGWLPGPWLRAASLPVVVMGVALVLFPVGIVLNIAVAPMLLALALPAASIYLAALWLVFGAAQMRRTAG